MLSLNPSSRHSLHQAFDYDRYFFQPVQNRDEIRAPEAPLFLYRSFRFTVRSYLRFGCRIPLRDTGITQSTPDGLNSMAPATSCGSEPAFDRA